MTYEEALKRIEEGEPFSEIYNADWEEAKQKAKEALEKQIRKPIEIINGDGYCPVCGYNYGDIAARKRFHMITPFCDKCGQSLSWGNEK